MIAAIHGACIGGGLNLITAADIRYCTSDAWFQNKEVDIGRLLINHLVLLSSDNCFNVDVCCRFSS